MKRLFYYAGIVLSLSFFGSCAQHDTKSPATSGGLPTTQPGVGVDTSSAGANTGTGTGGANMNNDGTNNNQQVNTGDTSQQR